MMFVSKRLPYLSAHNNQHQKAAKNKNKKKTLCFFNYYGLTLKKNVRYSVLIIFMLYCKTLATAIEVKNGQA